MYHIYETCHLLFNQNFGLIIYFPYIHINIISYDIFGDLRVLKDLPMEEAISLILCGCSLARELELNLGNNIDFRQPHLISRACDEILDVFSAAKERLISHERPPSTAVVPREVGLEDWLRSTCSQAMEFVQMQMTTPAPVPALAPSLAVVEEDSGKLMALGFAASSSSSSTKARRRYLFFKLRVKLYTH